MSAWIKRLALALAATLAAWLPAQADPMFASVALNGADTGAVVAFERQGDRLYAPLRELRRLGLQLAAPPGANADSPVDVRAIPGLRYRVDSQNQSVVLEADPELLPHRVIDASRQDVARADPSVLGASIDYAVNVQDKRAWAGGQVRIFGSLGVLTHGFVVDGGRHRRLETSLVLEDFERGRTLTIGDFISGGAASGRAVRAAGVRLATDVGLRPDLFSQPLVEVAGEAALPSNVELLVDGVRRYSATTEPGRFTVRAPPMVNSRGELSLVVTDALGRQTVTRRDFYAASNLLRPAATEYAVDAGWLRRGYATADDDYGPAFAAATLRRGVTDSLTLEGHAELSGDLRAGGLGAVADIGDAAMVTVAVDASHSRDGAAARLRAAVRRETAAYGVWAVYEGRTQGFRELGRRDTEPAGHDLQVGGALRAGAWGDLSLSYNRRASRRGRYDIGVAAWSRRVGRAQLFTAATLARDRYGGRTVSIGVTMPLQGGEGLASVGFDSQGGGRINAQVTQSPPDGPGWGWRAGGERSLSDGRTRGEAEVRRVSPVGEAALGVAADDRGASFRAYAAGSVVWLGGRPRLARAAGQALALVETGEPGVELMVENRRVGRTGRDGALLLVNLPAQAPSRVQIAAESVAMDADLGVDEAIVRPRRGGAVVLNLPVRHSANLQVQVVDPGGGALPVGAPVRLNDRPAGLVGFDSWIYLKDIGVENVIEIDLPDGSCRFRLDAATAVDGLAPPQVCGPGARGDLRRVRADGADRWPRSPELLGDDGGGGLRRVSFERRVAQDGPRRSQREVHVQRPRLPRLLLQLERAVRWLGFGDRSADDAAGRLRDAQVSALH